MSFDAGWVGQRDHSDPARGDRPVIAEWSAGGARPAGRYRGQVRMLVGHRLEHPVSQQLVLTAAASWRDRRTGWPGARAERQTKIGFTNLPN